MKKNQIGALVLILLMLLSTVGFTVFYNFAGPDGSSHSGITGQEIPDFPQQPTTVRYVNEGVAGTVNQMLPSIRVAASTTATNIADVDAAIHAYGGIRSIRSQFRQADQLELGQGLLYVSDISFERDVDRLDLVLFLENLDSLSGVDSLSFALVEVPKTITLSSQAKELGLEKQHTFPTTILEAFVTDDKMAGDEVNLSITVDYAGNTVQQTIAFEAVAPLSNVEQKQVFIAAEIFKVHLEIIIQATVLSDNLIDVNAFRDQFVALEGVDEAQVSLPQSFNPEEAVSKPVEVGVAITLVSGSEEAGIENTQKLIESLSTDFVIVRSAEISVAELDGLVVPEGIIPVRIGLERDRGDSLEFAIQYLVLGEQIITATGVEAG
jgi:hypothetical protein